MINTDFTNFTNNFSATDIIANELDNNTSYPSNIQDIVNKIGGQSYNDGLFVTYGQKDVSNYTEMIERLFPQAKDKIFCFGRDWLNRQFAVINYKPFSILQFDPNYRDITHIEVDLKQFFEQELILKCNDLCAKNYFLEWNKSLNYSQCSGYIIPLFLGGKDNIDNLQIVDSYVDLEILVQLQVGIDS